MARELDAILDHGEAYPAASCTGENGSVSFLEQIICPIYETMTKVSKSLLFLLISCFFFSCILDLSIKQSNQLNRNILYI